MHLLHNWRTFEADFAIWYRVDLAEAIWGPTPRTARWLKARMLGLPLESNTLRKLGAFKPGQWHNIEELLAQTMEVIYEGHRLLFKINSKKGRQPPPPLKVPRPAHVEEQTAKARRKRPATSEELARFLGHRSVIVNYTPKET